MGGAARFALMSRNGVSRRAMRGSAGFPGVLLHPGHLHRAVGANLEVRDFHRGINRVGIRHCRPGTGK